MRVAKLSHSASFWIGAAFVVLIALQILPIPGIYLMFLGAPLLAGLLVHLLLASLFLELIFGRIPMAFAAIPVLAYGAYYADYLHEGWQIHKEAGVVRSAEPDVALRFDPAEQSLVVKDARAFVSDYDVPVAYQVDANVKPEGYESYRLLPADQCAIVRDTRAMPGMSRLLAARRCVLRVRDARTATPCDRRLFRTVASTSCGSGRPESSRPPLSSRSPASRLRPTSPAPTLGGCPPSRCCSSAAC